MCDYVDQIGRRLRAVFQQTGKMSVVAAGVTGLLVLPPTLAVAEETRQEIALTAAEESLLIATRESATTHQPAANVSKSGGAAELGEDPSPLEPISQIPERSPELADESSRSESAGFGRELAQAATASKRFFDGASTDLAAAYQNGLGAEPAKFNGIQPDTSTKQDVLDAWDAPAGTTPTDGGEVLRYAIEPFQSVDVLVTSGKVSAIKITLTGGLPPTRLAKQLALDKFDPVVVTDEQGAALGEVFPERGVLFMYHPSSATSASATAAAATPTVSHVVIQPLDANAFALRAEERLHGPYDQNIHDLAFALSLRPDLAHSQWLLAEIYLATGRADQAVDAATAACELEPDNAAYQLRLAQARRLLGRYDEATRAVRAVVDREDVAPIIRAAALHELARLATLGDAGIASKAISFDLEAIRLADVAASSKNVKERRAAKRLLVEAHLAIARDVASHAYANKLESVSQWVGRASGLAEDFIANDGGSLELRLLVANEALAALASFKPSKDPTHFVAEAKQAAEALAERSNDNLWQRRIQWELGQAYFHAVQIEHLRLQSDAALRYGQLAIENLAEGAETRQAVHESEQLVGELYFQIGAVHAVHKQDHKTAIEWYGKAVPLLTAPRPFSELLVPQRQGEQLVSMGVSYWQAGQKDRALDLSLNGLELVQQAVDAGILTDASLAVPYGNLASMYQQLGETSDAAKFTELAKSVAKKSPAAATSSTEPARPRSMPNPGRPMSQVSRPRRTTQNQPAGQPVRRSTQREGQTLLR